VPPDRDGLLLAIAVLDADATVDHVAQLTDATPDEVGAGLAALARSGELERTGGVVRLTPIPTRLVAANPIAVAQLQARAAAVLFDAGAPATVVADHLLAAHAVREPWAVDALRSAAGQHRDAGDQRRAADVLRRVLVERPAAITRCEVLLELGVAEAHFDTDAAIATYREVLPLIDRRARSRHHIRLARLLGSANRVDEALAETDAAIEAAAPGIDRQRAEISYVSLARQSLDTRPLGRERMARLAETVDPRPTDPAGRTLLAELGYEQALGGSVGHRRLTETLTSAFGGASLDGIHDVLPAAQYVALLALGWCGEYRLAERAANLILGRSKQRGSEATYLAMHQVLANVYWNRGQLQDAIDAVDTVLGSNDASIQAIIPSVIGLKAASLATMGDIDAAYKVMTLPGGEERWTPAASFQGYLYWQSLVCEAADDHEASFRAAQRCGTLATAMGTINPAVLRWRTVAAEAALSAGRLDIAEPLATEAVQLARAFGAPAPLGVALRVAARCDPAGGPVALLREADALLRRTPERLEQTRLAIDTARAPGIGAAEAAAAVERAVELAAATGAALLGARALRPSSGSPAPVRTAAPRIEITTLAGFSVRAPDGVDATPSGVPGRAVRIVVAAARELHVEELADRLWHGDLSTTQLRARLRNVLARSATPAGPLLTRLGDRVALAPGVVVDADRFELAAELAAQQATGGGAAALDAAVAALSLYRGDFLPTDPYADWAIGRREHLRHRYLAISDLAVGIALGLSRSDVAVDILEATLLHDPHELSRYERTAVLLDARGLPSQARSVRARAAAAGSGPTSFP
jgi:DNA-binding SARP family transcriptional activator